MRPLIQSFLSMTATLAAAAITCAAHAGDIRRVTYLLGGTVSGPYRLTADLESGTIAEGATPAKISPDGAPAATLPATSQRRLAPAEQARIQNLAAAVWANGASKPPGTCTLTPDALARFEIAIGDTVKTFDASSPCMTDDANALQRAMYCAVHGDEAGSGCTKP